MSSGVSRKGVEKLRTEIQGFDLIAEGGLPKERVTLLAGTSGSAKTVFATQFLACGIEDADQSGVFVTFEEPPEDIRRNMLGLGWDIASWEAQNRWAFVDASPQPEAEPAVFSGRFDLGALLARISHAIQRVGAERVVIDSIGGIFDQLDDPSTIRRELFRISASLKSMGVTSIITAERPSDHGPISKFGVEEFVSDNVIVLRNLLDEEVRRRTVEILKFRGTGHQKGEWPLTIVPGKGVVVLPLSALELKQKSSATRVTSGNEGLDQMCGGGFFRDSVILVSGPTGTGKTLITTQFLSGASDKRCLLLAFEESREQLFRNAEGWGFDLQKMEAEGRLKLVCEYPESASLEDHLIRIKAAIEEFKPERVAVDSLSALERVSSLKSFREFTIGLSSFIKHKEIPALYTATTSTLLGGSSTTESHISTTTDSIILLRYVEVYGQMRRGLTVLKMRGSMHDKDIREFTIDSQGMHIGKPFRNIFGILSGNFSHVAPNELERLDRMFQGGTGESFQGPGFDSV